MRRNHEFLYRYGIVIILFVVACQSDNESVLVAVPTELITETAVPQPLLEPPGLLAQLTPTTTLSTTSETVTPSAVPITLISEAITLTPLPTLTGEQLELAVQELLTNPMNCDMPCWWGAVPSVTRLDEIKHTINPYNFHVSEMEEDGEVVHLLLETELLNERGTSKISVVYNFSHSMLTGVTGYAPSIFEFIRGYGQPDEIWLSAMNDAREDQPTMWINLIYLEAGIGVGYVAEMDKQDTMMVGCFTNQERGRLRLIVPNGTNSHSDFTPVFQSDRLYLLLEESTNLTIIEFVERFRVPSSSKCIETPAELWP